jgi:CheY-like chemotaxis protein
VTAAPRPEAPAIPLAMLIDDDAVDRMIYDRIIRRSGHVGETLAFASGEAALAFLRGPDRAAVDVIFLDVKMPRMDGFEFLAAATAALGDRFTVPVVAMLTTSLDPRDRARAAAFPMVRAYLNKPLAVEHLCLVARMVDEARAGAPPVSPAGGSGIR